MKRIFLLLIILIGSLSPSTQLLASHGMGGEITWTCLPTGQFRFELKFYRDCNGIPGPSNVTMNTTVPGVPNISLLLFDQNDISPDGLASNGVTACPTCSQGSSSNPTPGLVEEFIYRSAPINLPGVPPAAGWVFSWGECCRSNALTNITGAGGIGFQNRAVMYPYLGTNTFPCFDSSPYFAEKPSTIICTGYPFKYNPNAVDPEMDSLVYSWGQPLNDAGGVIPFAPGYSVNSQLPSPTQNGMNVAATINPSTGEISYTSFTGGYFATVVKVTAYKCGIKVAEIFREINVVLNNNCPPIQAGAQNLPPIVNAPFFDPVTGLQTSYIDTVYAGDTVNFMLTAQDFQFFTNGGIQNITIEGSGSQFGTNFTNPNAGCIIPPCATVSPGLPTTFPLAGSVTFNWVTTCAHNMGLDTLCTRISNIYNFVIKATDNYCPANASNVSTFSIVVLPPPKLDPPVLRCASVNLDGSVTLNWTKPTPRDSQNTYYSYEIYAALAAGGPWQLIDSLLTPYLSPASYSYTHSLADLTTLFGTNAQQQSIYYHLKTTSGCSGDSVSVASNVLRTIKLDVVLNGLNEAVLTWNALSTPPLSSHATKYKIYKQFPIGTWTLIDSTALLTYIDTTTKQLCSDTVSYRVELSDSTGCVSVSSLDGVQITNPNPIAAISPVNPAFCTGGSVTLTCTTLGLSYAWSTGVGGNSINVSITGTYTVTVTQNGGCTSVGSTTVTVNPLPTPNITGINVICDGATTTFDAGPYASYVWSNGDITQTTSLTVAGTYTVTVTDANNCTAIDTYTLTVNPNPVPVITGTTAICQGTTTILSAGGPYNGYLWSGGMGTLQTISVGAAGAYTVTVTNAFGCTGIDVENVVVNPLPVANITGDNSICQGQTTTFDGGAGYSYVWNTGEFTQTINPGVSAIYTVTITDANGCTDTDDITLTVNPNPVPVISGINVICQGQSSIFDPGPGYTYVWSTGVFTQTINVTIAGPYTVTVTDANGCTGTAVRNLTVNALPTAALSGIDTICFGQSTTIQVNFGGPGPYTYTYFDGTANQGPFTQPGAVANISVSPTATTGYTLVSVNNNNCQGTISGSANISVTPLPSAQILGTTAICDGDNTNLTIDFTGVGPYTYSYTAGATVFGPFTTSNDPETINVTPGATTTYGLTATVTGAGCVGATNAATAIVTVNDLPTVALSGDNTICDGTPTDLVFDFVGTGPFTYYYSDGFTTFGPFTTPNNPAIVTVTPGSTTTYTPVSISDINCTGSASGTANITVNPLPTATISGTAVICDGGNTDLSILFTGTGPFTYSYNDGPNVYGPFTTNQNPVLINVNPVTSTTYGVTTISDDNCTGTGSGTADITVIPLPTSDLTGSTEICLGSSTSMTLNFIGVPPFEYIYSDGGSTYGPFTVPGFTTSINVAPVNNTNYFVTYLTGSGCEGTPSGVVDIIVNAIPDAALSLSGDDVLCEGESSEFKIDFVGIAPYTYSYSDGTNVFGPFITSNNPEIIPVTPTATSNYSLVNFNDDKCTGTMAGTALVTVHPLPVATVAGTPAICEGSGTSFTVGFTGTGPYTYTYNDGNLNYGPFITSNNPETILVAPLVSTSYTVVTVSDANCVGSATGVANVTVNTIPSAIITGDAEICDGDVTNLNIVFNGVAPFSYTYSNGTNTIGPLPAPASPVSIPVSPSASTTYTLIAISDAYCPGTLSGTADVTVNPLPEPVITGDFEICDGESSTLTATPGFQAYSWSNGPVTPSIITTTPGVFTVSVTDLNGCVGTSPAINFIVNQTPVISFTNDTSLTCEIPAVNFINTSSYPAGSDFIWDFGDTSGSTLANPSHIFTAPGNYPITLTIVTQAGCTSTLTQPVEIMFFPLPEAKFTPAPKVTNVFNGKIEFTDQSEYAVSWLWEMGDGAKTTTQNPNHYYNGIGEYKVTLTVTNIAGCIDQYEDIVIINPFYIPNAFTPNADGINDYFFDAGYVLDVKSYKMIVFNRWGERVYEGNDYTKFWNGFDREGNKSPEGVYVYSIEVVTMGGKEHQFNGTVSLIR